MDEKKYIGSRIKEIRMKKGLRQRELAEMIGVAEKHMSKIECGYSYPSFDLIYRISRELNIDIFEFLRVEHLDEPGVLIEEINKKLLELDISQLRLFYRIVNDILC